MQVTEKSLEDFQAWLKRYGRSEGTMDQYVRSVRRSFAEGDPLEKLIDTNLSPKYLRLIKASLKAWAEFQGDTVLMTEVDRVKLPAAIRQKESVPLTKTEWENLREEISTATYLKEPMRGELGMLACRGFRRGDVLRLQRKEVTDALRKGVLSYEGKGRKRLEFTVTTSWERYLAIFADYKDWNRVEDLISPTAKQETRYSVAGKKVARALEKCGLMIGLDPKDLHPHLLRKTYATHYYRACLDPVKLQQHMQWSKVETALGYVGAGTREELDAIGDSLFE